MAEARRARAELVAEIQGAVKRAERPRLGDFAESWLERRAGRLRGSTLDRYASALTQIVPELGDYYVDAIRPGDVEDWQSKLMRRGYAPATVNGWLRVLRGVARDAARDLGVPYFAEGVRSLPEPATSGRRGRVLDVAQFRRFLAATNRCMADGCLSPDVGRMVLALAWTGLRRGELLALRWDRVRETEILIDQSVWRGQPGPTKTNDPRLVVVVSPLSDVLREQRRWLLEEQHEGLASGLVFPASPKHRTADHWYRTSSCLDRPLRLIAREAELEEFSAHALRRTWEGLLRRAKVDEMVRRSLGGWRTDTAQAIYSTVDSSERASAGDAVVRMVEVEGL